MLRPRSFVRSLALALIVAAASPVAAADLGLPIGDEAADPKVEFGTGWYIRGSAAWAGQSQPDLFAPSSPSLGSLSSDWALEIGGGYQFNQWFRSDLTYTFYGRQQTGANGASVNCPASLNPLYTNPADTSTIYGVAPDPSQCTPKQSTWLQKNLLLVNGYVDLGTYYGITPYIGAGVGAAYLVGGQSVDYYNANGTTYNATLTLPNPYPVPLIYYNPTTNLPLNPQPHYNTGTQNWNTSTSYRKLNFAFAFMAGIAYDLTKNAKLELGYRYVNFGTFSGINSLTGSPFGGGVSSQEVHVGIRYLID